MVEAAFYLYTLIQLLHCINYGLLKPKPTTMIFETKTDMPFPTSQFVIQGFAAPFRLDKANTDGRKLVYVRDDILSKLLNISYVSSNTECFVNVVN